MASIIADLATGAAQAAHAHAAALLASQQAKSGDKLPLDETLKETDATTPITLAPTGKTIFVRLPFPACASFHHPSLSPPLSSSSSFLKNCSNVAFLFAFYVCI
jgi:hypothetical protein